MAKRWLLVLAAGFSVALSAYGQDSPYIVVDHRLFAGRPDPLIIVTDTSNPNISTIRSYLQNLPPAPPPNWGYLTSKGYDLQNVGVSDLPADIIVFQGTIQEETADNQIQYFQDVNGLESFLNNYFPSTTAIKKTPRLAEIPSDTWLNIIGIFLPTNGYEPPYDPDFWNKNLNDRKCNNCYNYGVNKKNGKFAQPGVAGGLPITDVKCADVLASAISDGLVPWVADVPCSNYDYKVFLVTGLDPSDGDRDFHWYRQNPDGTWSHKRGGAPAKNVDESNKAITDPRTADRAFYSDKCGFMCVLADPSRVNVDGPGRPGCPK